MLTMAFPLGSVKILLKRRLPPRFALAARSMIRGCFTVLRQKSGLKSVFT